MYTNFEIFSNFNHKKAHTHFADFEQVIIKISFKIFFFFGLFIFLQYIIMVKATQYNLRRTVKRKGILGHQNKSNKELSRIIYKLKHITENLSKNSLIK